MARKAIGALTPSESKYPGVLGLARLRQKRGVSLEHIAESTKISIRFLRAIESEEFEKLPGGLFSTSYIKQYAAAISCDEGELLAQYHEKTAPPAPPGDALARKSPAAETRNWFGRWLGIAAEAPHS